MDYKFDRKMFFILIISILLCVFKKQITTSFTTTKLNKKRPSNAKLQANLTEKIFFHFLLPCTLFAILRDTFYKTA